LYRAPDERIRWDADPVTETRRLSYTERAMARSTWPREECPNTYDMCTCGRNWGEHHGILCPSEDRTWIADR
jgi:hypothetical protein